MKRILVFLGLKVAEIAGAFGVFALLSFAHQAIANTAIGAWLWLGSSEQQFKDELFFHPDLSFWLNGWMGVLAITLFAMILAIVAIGGGLMGFGLYRLIKKNWDWSWKLLHK